MSTVGQSAEPSSQNEATKTIAPTRNDTPNPNIHNPPTSSNTRDEKPSADTSSPGKIPSRRDQPSESTTPSTPEDSRSTRQVIAVSASKGPAAFFNLSRKFLVTDEEVDLSALEGAIVSAVDAAHLLERSKLATIVRYVAVGEVYGCAVAVSVSSHVPFARVQTSYVSVEPKRRKAPRSSDAPSLAEASALPQAVEPSTPPTAAMSSQHTHSPPLRPTGAVTPQGRELRRSRIIITMRRTESYKQWLLDNPLQAMGTEGDDDDDVVGGEEGTDMDEGRH